ncbi:MAG TPA: DUF4363 family protein [Desulfitobacterium dehalogenans]|uniref:DUF4363 family protein n=1 Tax=Desulfitobacterium dehalogenans TaxID=36854 RepID=A0A7C7D7J9_9FIRM|nr:DUF4363 family protein [Desulfitobacterium dehalogenans]
MRKFLVIGIPIITIAFFVLIMQSGNYLKNPLGNEVGIPERLGQIIQEIQAENWDSAKNHWDNLSEDWDKVVKRVQFSSERNEINDFTVSIARLRGAIEAQDKSSGLQLLYEAYEHWEDLGK